MPFAPELLLGIFLVAALYSSVGHGGASGYLALLTLYGFNQDVCASSALVLNLLVAGIAFYRFAAAGFFRWDLTWPFLVASVPFAFLGGLFHLTQDTYLILLGTALLISAIFMIVQSFRPQNIHSPEPLQAFHPWKTGVPAASGIGFLSGMLGIGGGIFLSPVIILNRWAMAKHTSATAAAFILANSAAGLTGRWFRNDLALDHLFPFLAVALLGSWIGSSYSAKFCSNRAIRLLLAIVLIVASVKMLFP